MSDNMKITMLGTTGAGKTCFMVGMYAVMQLGLHGFTLSAQDLDDDIDLSDNWERLTNGGEARFPAATSTTHNYAFDFNYGFRKLIGFEWLDYRGGALRDKSSELDVKDLEESLLQSSCVFLCISGEHLTNKIENPEHALKLGKESRADRMNLFLSRLREKRGPVPIVITITKFDLCRHRKKDIFDDIKQIFSGLFTPDGDWLVNICPASLGDLAKNSSEGEIVPKNLHLPLVFSIYTQYLQYGAHIKEQEQGVTNKLKELESQNRFMQWLNSDEIDKTKKDLQNNKAQTQELRDKLSLLAGELGKSYIYFNGEEQQFDV